MRIFTMIVSAIFVAIGISAIASGDSVGWQLVGFFGACLLVAIFEPRLPKPWLKTEFRLVITADEVVCEFRKRKRESIRWQEVERIWYVTTSGGPWLPDEWLVFEGMAAGCSFPTEAEGMKAIWDELEARFPGFDYKPIIDGGTTDAKHLCWERTTDGGRAATIAS
jgi:hypothetical protein